MLRCYVEHRFGAAARRTVDQANEIITEFEVQGYILTLRQLYYQFVQRNWIPNQDREYKRLGRVVKNAREAGLVSWEAIEDRGRNCYNPDPCETSGEVLEGIELGLELDMWARQDAYLEVWVEKQALEAVIQRPASRLHVGYMACKGFLSASESWRAGVRFQAAQQRGKRCVLIHLADHDPSGLDMTRDNRKRLHTFAESHDIEVRRIALNMDQIEEHGPPPNPAKETDSRFAEYRSRFGENSWELDALPPAVIDGLITDTIEEYRDKERWYETLIEQEEARRPLVALRENWDAIEHFLSDVDLIV